MYYTKEHTETQGRVTFTLSISEEDEGPEGSFASGDDALDEATLAWIRKEVQSGNQWAWCIVKVTASIDGFEGESEFLGGCSYKSREDFVGDGASDYYASMKAAALVSLKDRLKRAMVAANELGVTL